jgi:hypothetical protein
VESFITFTSLAAKKSGAWVTGSRRAVLLSARYTWSINATNLLAREMLLDM